MRVVVDFPRATAAVAVTALVLFCLYMANSGGPQQETITFPDVPLVRGVPFQMEVAPNLKGKILMKARDVLPDSLRAAVALGRSGNGIRPPIKMAAPGAARDVPLLNTVEEQTAAGRKLMKLLGDRPVDYKCSQKNKINNYKSLDSWTYCADEKFQLKPPCLVYSIGVNWDFSFEDAMEKLGCHVLSYDPSMDAVAHRHSPRVYFQPIGLSHADRDDFIVEGSKKGTYWGPWKVRTLSTLIEENNHTGRTIDMLKFDVETSEWNVTQNLIDSGVLSNVKQMLLEWHVFPHAPKRPYYGWLVSVMERLQKAGMASFYQLPHGHIHSWPNFNLQADVGYINKKFT